MKINKEFRDGVRSLVTGTTDLSGRRCDIILVRGRQTGEV